MEDGRLHAVSDPLVVSPGLTSFDFDQSFRLPDPAFTGPLDSSSFDLEFYSPLSFHSCANSIPSKLIMLMQPVKVALTSDP